MDDQGRKVQKSDRDRRLLHVEEVLGKRHLVHKELKLKEVVPWCSGHIVLSCRHSLLTL